MSILKRLGRRRKTSSSQVAQERLRLVLAHDRANIPPGLLETMKDEIIAVISSHVEVDRDGVQVTVTQGTRENRLVADIPLKTRRGRRR